MILRLLLDLPVLLGASLLLAKFGCSLTACRKLLDGVRSQITSWVLLFFVEGCG